MSHLDCSDVLRSFVRSKRWILGLVGVALLALALPALAATSLVYNGSLDLATIPFVDYTLAFGAGTAVTVKLDCMPNALSNALDPAMTITGPGGFAMTDDDSGLIMCTYGGTAEATFTVTTEGLYTIRASSAYYLGLSVSASHASGSYQLTIQIDGAYAVPTDPGAPWNPGDDRLNGNPRDQAAPVAIYPDPMQVYAIDPTTGQGLLVLGISADQVAAVGVPVGANATLGETVNPYTGQPILISRLTTGEFQLNTADGAGNPYVVIWDTDGNVYHP